MGTLLFLSERHNIFLIRGNPFSSRYHSCHSQPHMNNFCAFGFNLMKSADACVSALFSAMSRRFHGEIFRALLATHFTP